jgi:hypothetical protein
LWIRAYCLKEEILKQKDAWLERLRGDTPSEENGMIKKETKTGTFYYDGDRIELDDGTILRFSGGVITDEKGNRYTKQ